MRWDPFTELSEWRSRLDRRFDEWPDGRGHPWTPAIDVVREDDRLVMRADLPGIKPDEVKIEFKDDMITVSGEHRESKEEKDRDYVRRERRYGSFSRSVSLPVGVDPKKIEAITKDGVIELTIPLPKEAQTEPVEITPTPA